MAPYIMIVYHIIHLIAIANQKFSLGVKERNRYHTISFWAYNIRSYSEDLSFLLLNCTGR